MDNKFLKSFLLGLTGLFLLTLTSCSKEAETKAIITVIDINKDPVQGAKVRLHQDGLISSTGNISQVFDEQWTDNNGQTEHVFEHEAILNVSVKKMLNNNTDSIIGENVIRLLKEKTVSKTVEID